MSTATNEHAYQFEYNFMKFTIIIVMFTCCHVKLMFLFTFTKMGFSDR